MCTRSAATSKTCAIGDSLLTHRRTVGEADIVAFGGISGDYFYMHFDEVAAKQSPFGKRIAHGYFVLSAAAGLFVSPSPGPVLANYGLDTLRFTKPVGIGDTIQARLTCKRKIDRNKKDASGQWPGRGGMGRGSDEPGRRAGRQLRYPDARFQETRNHLHSSLYLMFDLTGKVALVTGGNGGIGLGMAQGLAEAGARVIVAARNAQKSAAAVEALKALGSDSFALDSRRERRGLGAEAVRRPPRASAGSTSWSTTPAPPCASRSTSSRWTSGTR